MHGESTLDKNIDELKLEDMRPYAYWLDVRTQGPEGMNTVNQLDLPLDDTSFRRYRNRYVTKLQGLARFLSVYTGPGADFLKRMQSHSQILQLFNRNLWLSNYNLT